MTGPMADDTVPDDTAAEQPAEAEDRPRGTLLITSLFLVALIVVWAAMYFMMLSRS